MSWHGRQVVLHLDHGEAKIEVGYWHRHEGCLTTAEKKRIKGGNYNSFRRPHPPSFTKGDWLRVNAKIEIEIADVLPWKGRYRIRIARVRDFRSTAGSRITTYGETRASMENTLAVIRSNPPEPHGPGEHWLRRYAEDARIKQADRTKEAIEG